MLKLRVPVSSLLGCGFVGGRSLHRRSVLSPLAFCYGLVTLLALGPASCRGSDVGGNADMSPRGAPLNGDAPEAAHPGCIARGTEVGAADLSISAEGSSGESRVGGNVRIIPTEHREEVSLRTSRGTRWSARAGTGSAGAAPLARHTSGRDPTPGPEIEERGVLSANSPLTNAKCTATGSGGFAKAAPAQNQASVTPPKESAEASSPSRTTAPGRLPLPLPQRGFDSAERAPLLPPPAVRGGYTRLAFPPQRGRLSRGPRPLPAPRPRPPFSDSFIRELRAVLSSFATAGRRTPPPARQPPPPRLQRQKRLRRAAASALWRSSPTQASVGGPGAPPLDSSDESAAADSGVPAAGVSPGPGDVHSTEERRGLRAETCEKSTQTLGEAYFEGISHDRSTQTEESPFTAPASELSRQPFSDTGKTSSAAVVGAQATSEVPHATAETSSQPDMSSSQPTVSVQPQVKGAFFPRGYRMLAWPSGGPPSCIYTEGDSPCSPCGAAPDFEVPAGLTNAAPLSWGARPASTELRPPQPAPQDSAVATYAVLHLPQGPPAALQPETRFGGPDNPSRPIYAQAQLAPQVAVRLPRAAATPCLFSQATPLHATSGPATIAPVAPRGSCPPCQAPPLLAASGPPLIALVAPGGSCTGFPATPLRATAPVAPPCPPMLFQSPPVICFPLHVQCRPEAYHRGDVSYSGGVQQPGGPMSGTAPAPLVSYPVPFSSGHTPAQADSHWFREEEGGPRWPAP